MSVPAAPRLKVALALAAPWMLHCSAVVRPRPEGEAIFLAGNLPRAAAALEGELSNTPPERLVEHILHRLVTIYAAPGETFDPERSQELADRLLQGFPQTRFRTEVLILRGLTRQLLALETRADTARAVVADLEQRTRGCHQSLAEQTDERSSLLRMGEEEVASRRSCEQALALLRRRVLERDEEIGRLNESVAALERLRRIDTEIDPGGR